MSLADTTNIVELVVNGTENVYVAPKLDEARRETDEFAETEKSETGVVVAPMALDTEIVQSSGMPTRARL